MSEETVALEDLRSDLNAIVTGLQAKLDENFTQEQAVSDLLVNKLMPMLFRNGSTMAAVGFAGMLATAALTLAQERNERR